MTGSARVHGPSREYAQDRVRTCLLDPGRQRLEDGAREVELRVVGGREFSCIVNWVRFDEYLLPAQIRRRDEVCIRERRGGGHMYYASILLR